MSGIPRMRSIQQCADYLKENDPDSCIGTWFIRKMVHERKIPYVQSGCKTLINLDTLILYLSGEEKEGQAYGK